MAFQNLFYIEIMKSKENKYYRIFPGADFLETLKDSSNQSFTVEGGKETFQRKKKKNSFFNTCKYRSCVMICLPLNIIFFLQCLCPFPIQTNFIKYFFINGSKFLLELYILYNKLNNKFYF